MKTQPFAIAKNKELDGGAKGGGGSGKGRASGVETEKQRKKREGKKIRQTRCHRVAPDHEEEKMGESDLAG